MGAIIRLPTRLALAMNFVVSQVVVIARAIIRLPTTLALDVEKQVVVIVRAINRAINRIIAALAVR